jgi:DNA replication and repair protein RecF
MKINFVELKNFRIFDEFRCGFEDRNVLFGENGSGKTTVIEGLYYGSVFSPLRSFETDKDLVKSGENFFNLKINFSDDKGDTHDIFVGYKIEGDESKKKIMFDGKVTNVVSTSGKLKVVPFLIEDFEIVFGSPSWRRNTMNNVLFSVSSSYYANLINYSKILKRKNALIKMIGEKRNEGSSGAVEDMILLLRNYNESLAKYAVELTFNRLELVENVNNFMLNENLPFEIKVKYKSNIANVVRSSSDPVGELRDYLNQNAEREISYSKSIIGPHLDDLVLYTEGDRVARVYLSQGQVRMVSILFKLSLAKYIHNKTGESPVLLFDDVIGELDESNKKMIFNRLLSLKNTQIVIALSENKYVFRDSYTIKLR